MSKITVDFQKVDGQPPVYTIPGLLPTDTVKALKDKIRAQFPIPLFEFGNELADENKPLSDYGMKVGMKYYLTGTKAGGRRKSRKPKRRSTKKRSTRRARRKA